MGGSSSVVLIEGGSGGVHTLTGLNLGPKGVPEVAAPVAGFAGQPAGEGQEGNPRSPPCQSGDIVQEILNLLGI